MIGFFLFISDGERGARAFKLIGRAGSRYLDWNGICFGGDCVMCAIENDVIDENECSKWHYIHRGLGVCSRLFGGFRTTERRLGSKLVARQYKTETI